MENSEILASIEGGVLAKGKTDEEVYEIVKWGRFADPRNCQTLDDVVGKEDEIGRPEIPRKIDWVPRKLDIARIAEVIAIVQDELNENRPLKVVDIAGHNGFLDRLVLDELDRRDIGRVSVDIVDPDEVVTTQGKDYYDDVESRLNFRTETSTEYVEKSETADVVICSWMRPEMDLRPDIESLNPRVIIFVKDLYGDVGQPQSFVDNEKYTQAASWLGFSGHNIDSIRCSPVLFPGEIHPISNVVLIMTRTGESLGATINEKLKQNTETTVVLERYPWEKELELTTRGQRVHDIQDFEDWYQDENE